MRQKYAQLDNKYQQDLDEARRGAEALASQVAAQSSLISTLKREMSASLDTVRGQKLAMQELEARGNSDLEKAMRDIAHLHDRLTELNAVIEAKKDDAARANVTLADLRSVAANASAEKNAAEATRQRTLESYGRVYMVTRYLLQRWRVERRDKLAVLESFEKVRVRRRPPQCPHRDSPLPSLPDARGSGSGPREGRRCYGR
jgi:chromosome segregation ATPase